MKQSTRTRGRRLQAIRSRHFAEQPLCVMCNAKGLTKAATELDHILALTNGGHDVQGNRQGLCESCHRDKTATDLGHRVKAQIGLDGWPITCALAVSNR